MIEIIVAVITGVISIVGVMLTNSSSNNKIEGILETKQAVTDCKIEELTREVRLHNDFATRIPIIEQKLENTKERIDRIERGHDR